MGCCKKKKVKGRKAASSLAPSDKYHNNPQGGHRHSTGSNGVRSSVGVGETTSNNTSLNGNNNAQFSHNGITYHPPTSGASQQQYLQQYNDEADEDALLNEEEQLLHHQLIIQGSLTNNAAYHHPNNQPQLFYPTSSVGSSESITLSSQPHHHHHQQQHHHHNQSQLPYLVYKSNHSSSGNGSHSIIDGSTNGSVVEGSNNKYYYYYNGHYYPTTEEGGLVTTSALGAQSSDQVFPITAITSGKEIIMGRVGEEVYHPTGSAASVSGGGGNHSTHSGGSSVGLFKSKSGSIPGTLHGSPQTRRGFRDTFINSMSPGNNHHAHSAESSPLHRSASATTAAQSDKYSNSSANGKIEKELGTNKKWTFGGLFRRNKQKSSSSSAVGATSQTQTNNNSIVSVENGGASSTNSNCNSPAKIVNNNYGSSSPIIIRPAGGALHQRTSHLTSSPARPASSVGFISVDPNARGSLGQSENYRRSTASVTSTPKFVNAESQTRAKGKLSESDISTCDSDFELAIETHHLHENPPEPAPQETGSKGNGGNGTAYKQNFLVRRLSRRKEKAAAKKAAALAAAAAGSTSTPPKQQSSSSSTSANQQNPSNGFISSSQQNQLDVTQNQLKRRVGSSPDSLNNSSEPWPSWETTKKPQPQLQALQHHQQQRLLQNYSSNGSLSLSQQEGGGGYASNNSNQNTPSKSSRAAAKEAVKARAILRRESFLHDSSSSDDDTEERSPSSLQGSFSSLNSRNKRQRAFNMQQAQFQQQRHLFPATNTTMGTAGISCASPSSPMPVPLDYRNVSGGTVSTNSPNMNRRLMMMGPPGSPKWEARLIYHQEQQQKQADLSSRSQQHRNATTTTTNPSQMSQNNGEQGYIMATEMISEDNHVVTAGLKVPFLPVQTQPQQDQQSFHNGIQYPDDPVQYANVANGIRGRSLTPYNNPSTSSANASAIHHASATPPPPPRRDFSRANPTSTTTTTTNSTNPNFYRPVSCSYLDSYASQLQEQQMRQHSAMISNGNYIYPQPSAQQHHHHQQHPPNHYHQYQGQQQEIIMNGFASHFSPAPLHNFDGGLARSSPRHFIHSLPQGNNNQAEVETNRHAPLIRSPSEPPNIRTENVRISSPAKRLISSPMSNGNTSENPIENSDGGGKSSPGGKNVITSKLGFPVRRLQETSKLASGTQSPVHLRASEFWRKKESETSSPVGGVSSGNTPTKKYLNRIRSADSSPLPVPKMRKSPGVVSNESISSLSSFSENAGSPGPPKNCSSPIVPGGIKKHHGGVTVKANRAQLSKTPNPQQLTYGNNNKDKENNNTSQQQSAVERLKVRIPSAPDGINKIASGNASTSTNPPVQSTSSKTTTTSESANNTKPESNNNPIRALIELNNGKTPGKNLEDALNELEDMYKSLRLSDEDLLDRAERRDLPVPHQELRDAPLIPIPQAYLMGSVESLGTGSGSSGTNYTAHSSGGTERVRAPPVRRSIRPDTVSDDMANRRLAFPDGKPLDPRVVVAKTGSYLARSPAFSPCTSPCPPDGGHHPHYHNNLHHGFPLAFLGQEEPDLTLDDVSFRNYKRANSIRIIDPQPKFGIPLGPITAAPANDYLHSKPSESYRPIFGHLKTPDVVNDDIAFRNLRKDLGQEAALQGKDWTPRLFSPNRDVQFNYPKVKDSKKLRAIRSLSANITHMIPPSPLLSHQQQQFRDNVGKWSSYTDLHTRRGSPARASSYLQPSWVEQIEKAQSSETETLTDHRNSSQLSTAILDPPEHWERKFPRKTIELTPPIYDPNKPRRPWTDIILESFEKAAAAAAEEEARANEAQANNKTEEGKTILDGNELVVGEEDDDDVFIDASEEVSGEGKQPRENFEQRNTIKISGNSSKNNDPDSMHGTPNMENWSVAGAIPYLLKPMPLLPGQKTRRGSWVEPSRSYSTSETVSLNVSHNSASHHQSDRRRNSWSDLPKDIDSYTSSTPSAIMLEESSCSASPTKKLFNPLPPPKKIRQINLEAFNNNNSSQSSSNQSASMLVGQRQNNLSSANVSNNNIIQEDAHRQDGNVDKDGKSKLTCSSPDKVKASPKEQEDELNELMDQLLKDADACSQSIEEDLKESDATKEEKKKSISTLETASVPQEEMKMDGKTSSSEESCKQDLSCAIVGIIPKQQQSSPETDRNNQRVEQQKEEHRPTFSDEEDKQRNKPTISATLATTSNKNAGDCRKSSPDSSAMVLGGSTREVFKIDNDDDTNGKGNVVSVPKDRNTLSPSSRNNATDPSTKTVDNKRNRVGAAGGTSSIEDLIDSINESLPELEASCGSNCPANTTLTATTSTHSNTSSDGKPNGSSSGTGSPASSIPSPSPGSPTPPVLSVSLKETNTDDCGSSAFPVPAKRHHLPNKAIAEESLYENLPMMLTPTTRIGGNDDDDEKASSSLFTYKEGESENLDEFSSGEKRGKIPPLISTTDMKDTPSPRKVAGRRDDNNDERADNEEEEETHHSNSSSHQPSSLSSNDSSEVCPSSSTTSPREGNNTKKYHDQEQEHDPTQNTNKSTNSTNNFKDNYNSNQQQDQTCSLNSSSTAPFDGTSSSLSFDTFTTSTTTTTTKSNNKNNTQGGGVIARTRSSSSSSASGGTTSKDQLRKKSEGSLPGYPSERDDCNKTKIYSEQNSCSSPPPTTLEKLSPPQKSNDSMKPGVLMLGKENGAICNKAHTLHQAKAGAGKEDGKTLSVGMNHQPVASSASTSAVNSYFSMRSQGTRRSSTSTTLAATQSTAAETSASETGGMSFLRNNFPFFRNSTSRSRSQSVVSDVSRSSETGDSKKEKDKSYRRKSHLNRAFTDEPVPNNNYAFDFTPKSSKPTSQEASSLENSAVEECRTTSTKPNVKLHPAIPSVLTCNNNKSDSNLFQGKSISRQNSNGNNNFESMPASPIPISNSSQAKDQQHRKSTPVVKKDSFSDAEGVSFIKKMLQKESDRDRVAAAASSGKQNGATGNAPASTVGNCSSGYNIKKSPSAGNQSYWSKFSSSQSAFLRKLFDKPKVADSPISQNQSKSCTKNISGRYSSCNGAPDQDHLTNGNQSEENSGEKCSSEKENAEPVLGFSVAQKASYFMKLEHEQRFSKWRKNSVDLGIISKATGSTSALFESVSGKGNPYSGSNGGTNNLNEFRPRSSRHLTQPVTPTELMDIAPLVNNFSLSISSGNHTQGGLGSQLKDSWDKNFPSGGVEKGMTDSAEKLNKNDPSTDPKSFYKDYDEFSKLEPLVTRERVSKFDEIVTRQEPLLPAYPVAPPTPTMKSYSLTRSSRTNGACNGLNNLGGFPMYHSASAIISNSNSSTATSILTNKISCAGGGGSGSTKSSGTTFYKNPCAGYSSSSSSFSEAMSRYESTKFLPLTKTGLSNSRQSATGDSPLYDGQSQVGAVGGKRRGSASDLELSGAGATQQSPLLPRQDKVKSMFVSRAPTGYHCDTENLSEDGEFSSGGQEVAEIICRSYENSPVFRKKNWRTQKQAQANFTKEIWRRCGNYENWSQKSSYVNACPQKKPQPHHPSSASALPQTFTATTNVIEVSTAPPPTLPTVAPSPPPSTSNLLQILTVLSSSNDELNEPKPKPKKYHHRQGSGNNSSSRQILSSGSGSDSIPPIHPGHNHHNNLNNTACVGAMPPVLQADQIYVSVPHPEDEAFQSFFCSVKSYTQVTHYPSTSGVTVLPSTTNPCVNGDMNGQILLNSHSTTTEPIENLDITSVRRESDLLVMKKNIPQAKRKSTSGKYKNPLRALAARIDFRHQGYTQPTSNNTVQSSSDLDLTT